jgi:beta-lactamase class A
VAVFPTLGQAVTDPFEAYEGATGGRIGVYAENLATGAKIEWRAEARFVMCSTFKASLAGLVLARVDQGRDDLKALIRYGARDLQEYAPVARENLARGAMSVAEMCAGAVELSDNTCANLLLARVGGPAALTGFWRSMGDEFSRLDHDEPLLNRTPLGALEDTTTPAAMAATLRRLVLGAVLSLPSRERLTAWLVNCKTGANRLRAGLPGYWRVANKTGNNGKDAAGDIAVAWPKPDAPILICVYTRGGVPTARQLEVAFTEIGRLAAQRLA